MEKKEIKDNSVASVETKSAETGPENPSSSDKQSDKGELQVDRIEFELETNEDKPTETEKDSETSTLKRREKKKKTEKAARPTYSIDSLKRKSKSGKVGAQRKAIMGSRVMSQGLLSG